MLKFELLFDVRLGTLIFRHSDNLSSASALHTRICLQLKVCSLAQLSLRVLKKMRCDEDFSAYYQLSFAWSIACWYICSLPSKKMPYSPTFWSWAFSWFFSWVSGGSLPADLFWSTGPCYWGYSWQIWPTWVQNLEQLIVKDSKGNPYNDELDEVYRFCGSDLSKDQLKVQLPLLQPLCEKTDQEVESIHKILHELSSSERRAFSSVGQLWNFYL